MIDKKRRKLISQYFQLGKDEKDWYNETAETLSPHFGENTGLFIGFLASTSPNSTVKSNVTLALKAYGQYSNGESFNGFLRDVKINLQRTVDGLELFGPKVSPFWKALLGDETAVVIDRWILRAYGFATSTPKRREFIEKDIRRRSIHAKVSPREYQAAVWFGIKYANGDRLDNRPYEDHVLEKLDPNQKRLPIF